MLPSKFVFAVGFGLVSLLISPMPPVKRLLRDEISPEIDNHDCTEQALRTHVGESFHNPL